MNKTRVLVAAEEGILRAGLRMLLEEFPDIEVVAEADNGPDAIEKALHFKLDILVIDVSRPGCLGLDAIRELRHSAPSVHVLALSTCSEDYLLPALKAGAAGYILKEAEPQELYVAISSLARGHHFLSPAVTKPVISNYIRWHDDREDGANVYRILTVREREVLCMAAEGLTNREMAGTLRLSIKTVEKHRANMMSKLGLHTRGELMHFAVTRGLTGGVL